MEKIESILVAIDRNGAASSALARAGALARRFGARIELFMSDAVQAYELKHQYDSSGVGEARACSVAESRRFLKMLRNAADVEDLKVGIDATSESPLYEAIVHKVQRSCPDLVIRGIGAVDDVPAALDTTDWALVRACPVPLLLTRGRAWRQQPRIAAAVDISAEETPELTRKLLRAAGFLKSGMEGTMDVIHADMGADADSRTRLLRERIAQAEVEADALRVIEGDPVRTLPEFALRSAYDVLVLGALTHRKALTALVGTLTGRLIETLDCDFLLVKPEDYVCPVSPENENRNAGATA